MTDTANPIYARADTMLGLCHALSEETGVPASCYRIALALALFWNPAVVIVGYLVAGLAANVLRWLLPLPVAPAAPPQVSTADNNDQAPLAKAA